MLTRSFTQCAFGVQIYTFFHQIQPKGSFSEGEFCAPGSTGRREPGKYAIFVRHHLCANQSNLTLTGYGIRDRSPFFCPAMDREVPVSVGLLGRRSRPDHFSGSLRTGRAAALAAELHRDLDTDPYRRTGRTPQPHAVGRFPDAPPFFQPHHQVPHRGFIALFGPNHLRRLQPGGQALSASQSCCARTRPSCSSDWEPRRPSCRSCSRILSWASSHRSRFRHRT